MSRPKKHTPEWLARKTYDQIRNCYPSMNSSASMVPALITLRELEPYFTAGHWFFEKYLKRMTELHDRG